MEAIERVNEADILAEATRLAEAGDSVGLSNLVHELEQKRRAYEEQARVEARRITEAQQAQAQQRGNLAYLDPQDAVRARVEQTVAAELHAERARACQTQAEILTKLLVPIRQHAERLAARAFAVEIVSKAEALQAELADAKKALEPLREVVEKVLALGRRVNLFNQQVQHVHVPPPSLWSSSHLSEITNGIHSLELRIPPDLAKLAGQSEQKAA